MNPINPAASQNEDVLVFPDSWGRAIDPRRSGYSSPTGTLDRRALETVERLIEKADTTFSSVFTSAATEKRLAAEVRAYLDGSASPVGAAATVRLVEFGGEAKQVKEFAVFADVWTEVHGIAFAAAAVGELARWRVSRGHGSEWRLLNQELPTHEWVGEPIARRLRTLLAQVDDADHEAAVAELAARRDREFGRIVAAYLVPSRADWVTELCNGFYLTSADDIRMRMLLRSIGNVEQLTTLDRNGDIEQVLWPEGTLETLADAIGGPLARTLVTMVERSNLDSFDRRYGDLRDLGDDTGRARAFAILAALPTDEAFDLLVERVDRPQVATALLDAVHRFPRRALRRLATAATGTTAAARTVRRVLTGHVQDHPALAAEVLPQLPADPARALAAAMEAKRVEDAPIDSLPGFLLDPPWNRARAQRKQIVLSGLTSTVTIALDWEPGERERWADDTKRLRQLGGDPDWNRIAAEFRSEYRHHHAEFFARGPEELVRPLLSRWKQRPDALRYQSSWIRPLLARYEHEFVDWALELTSPGFYNGYSLDVLLPIVDSRVAELFLRKLRSAADRPIALAWFRRHPRAAAELAIPDALGKPGARRREAEAVLRLIAAEDARDQVMAAAKEYGEQAEAAIESMLAIDPLEVRPATKPALGTWLEPALLPPLMLRGQTLSLPSEAVRTALETFTLCGTGERHPGVDLLVEICDSTSLSEFVAAVLDAWLAADMPSKNSSWVLPALAQIGDDATVRRLVPLIKVWPGKSQHKRAIAGLDVLAGIGSDLALSALHQIGEKLRYSGLRMRAKEKIVEIAEERGLSTEELGDRLVPDLGLAGDGTTELDYGSRRFTIGFDEALKPVVRNEEGKLRKSLPKPGAKDDPAKAPAAYQLFAGMKKDLRTIAGGQIERFERAMATQRRWSATDFRQFIVGHPLLWHLAARLVWIVEEEGRVTGTLRIAEDRTFSNVADETISLPETARVGIAHPQEIPDSLPAWGERFADYEILQPFPQLSRTTRRLTDQDAAGHTLTRFAGAEVSIGALLGLASRGWDRDVPGDAGGVHGFSRSLPDGSILQIAFEPGYAVGYPDGNPEQRLTEVGIDYHRTGRTLGQLSPIAVAELIYEVERLVG